MRVYTIFLTLLFLGSNSILYAQVPKAVIKDFKVIEEQQRIKIIVFENETPNDQINGTYLFSINGFNMPLKFKQGKAILEQEFPHSTFLYLFPDNQSIKSIKLYYLQKIGETNWPVNIPIVLLLLIPLCFIVIAYFVKKLIYVFVAIFIAFFALNSGLSVGDYFEVLLNWIVNLF